MSREVNQTNYVGLKSEQARNHYRVIREKLEMVESLLAYPLAKANAKDLSRLLNRIPYENSKKISILDDRFYQITTALLCDDKYRYSDEKNEEKHVYYFTADDHVYLFYTAIDRFIEAILHELFADSCLNFPLLGGDCFSVKEDYPQEGQIKALGKFRSSLRFDELLVRVYNACVRIDSYQLGIDYPLNCVARLNGENFSRVIHYKRLEKKILELRELHPKYFEQFQDIHYQKRMDELDFYREIRHLNAQLYDRNNNQFLILAELIKLAAKLVEYRGIMCDYHAPASEGDDDILNNQFPNYARLMDQILLAWDILLGAELNFPIKRPTVLMGSAVDLTSLIQANQFQDYTGICCRTLRRYFPALLPADPLYRRIEAHAQLVFRLQNPLKKLARIDQLWLLVLHFEAKIEIYRNMLSRQPLEIQPVLVPPPGMEEEPEYAIPYAVHVIPDQAHIGETNTDNNPLEDVPEEWDEEENDQQVNQFHGRGGSFFKLPREEAPDLAPAEPEFQEVADLPSLARPTMAERLRNALAARRARLQTDEHEEEEALLNDSDCDAQSQASPSK